MEETELDANPYHASRQILGGYASRAGRRDLSSPSGHLHSPTRTRTREIAFAWIVGLAVTDRYAYVADAINKRVARMRLGYAPSGTCSVP